MSSQLFLPPSLGKPVMEIEKRQEGFLEKHSLGDLSERGRFVAHFHA